MLLCIFEDVLKNLVMKKNLFVTLALFFMITSYGFAQQKVISGDCIEGINLLPLYGGIEKCAEQKLADERFLSDCDKAYSSRQEAAVEHVKIAWSYAEQNDMETSVKRFNQAYLLDSLNADVYWGLGIIQGARKEYYDAETLFRRSLKLNPQNEKVWFCLAVNIKEQYGDGDEKYKKQRIDILDKILKINPNFYPAIQMWQQEMKSSSNASDEMQIIVKPADK